MVQAILTISLFGLLLCVMSIGSFRKSFDAGSVGVSRSVRAVHWMTMSRSIEALVNTVNTVGIMGKGIALAFKQGYPENYEAYRKVCDDGDVEVGRMFVYENRALGRSEVDRQLSHEDALAESKPP